MNEEWKEEERTEENQERVGNAEMDEARLETVNKNEFSALQINEETEKNKMKDIKNHEEERTEEENRKILNSGSDAMDDPPKDGILAQGVESPDQGREDEGNLWEIPASKERE